ncbi:hypothetical protein SynBIOSU31_00963 [Synechococcus sp. BIOS-U3-1]|nr:hypothetical protein SynBIOSU31_00963 [Synechococcus sp. BIOS-U3-1]
MVMKQSITQTQTGSTEGSELKKRMIDSYRNACGFGRTAPQTETGTCTEQTARFLKKTDPTTRKVGIREQAKV